MFRTGEVKDVGHSRDTDGDGKRARGTEELIVSRARIKVGHGLGRGGHGGGHGGGGVRARPASDASTSTRVGFGLIIDQGFWND